MRVDYLFYQLGALEKFRIFFLPSTSSIGFWGFQRKLKYLLKVKNKIKNSLVSAGAPGQFFFNLPIFQGSQGHPSKKNFFLKNIFPTGNRPFPALFANKKNWNSDFGIPQNFQIKNIFEKKLMLRRDVLSKKWRPHGRDEKSKKNLEFYNFFEIFWNFFNFFSKFRRNFFSRFHVLNYKCSTKDKILDRVYLKFELRSICTDIVYTILHFLTKGMEGRV